MVEIKDDIRVSIPQQNEEKFREVFMYILNKVGSRPNIGQTVIYKLLYFIDFDYYEKFETQLMGAVYTKNHYGPTPVDFKKVIDQMIKNNDIEEVKSEYFGKEQTKYLPHREANINIFSANEIKHIDDVIGRLCHLSASKISDLSHRDVPYIIAGEQEQIDYEAVFYRNDETSRRGYE